MDVREPRRPLTSIIAHCPNNGVVEIGPRIGQTDLIHLTPLAAVELARQLLEKAREAAANQLSEARRLMGEQERIYTLAQEAYRSVCADSDALLASLPEDPA